MADPTQTFSQQSLADALEGVSDGLLVLDPAQRVIYINSAAEQLTNRARADLLAKTLWEGFPESVGTEFQAQYDRAQREAVPVEYEAFSPRLGKWFAVRVHPSPQGTTIYFRDVTATHQASASIRHSEERFRRVFEESPLGMMLVRPDHHVQQVNPAMCRMLGYSAEELTGRTWMDLTHPDDVQAGIEATERLFSGQYPSYRGDKRYIRKDGRVVWARVSLSLVRTEDGEAPHRLVMVEDITERRRVEEERDHLLRSEQTARAEAEAANRRKDQFLAILSHELRTPLTPVLARLELLKRDSGLSPSVRDSLGRIRRSVELEANLIDDLLDITRISQGKLRLSLEAVNAHEKITDALEIYQKEIRNKHLTVTLELDAEQHEVRADAVRLEQIFWNLLSNAVKYTGEGGTITIRTANKGGDLVVEVIDTGIGIQPEMMERLFRAFEQGEQALTRRYGGLGLGVTITKALVEMHGGRISARSEGLNKGATFTVELPVFVRPAAEVMDKPLRQRRRAKILLVEDNQDTLRILARLLRSMGHEVKTACNVHDAQEIAGVASLDLIISDIGLPDGSGWELMRHIRAQRNIRGVALSGFSTEQDKEKSREAGFEAHLTKPIDLQKLDEVIGRFAGRAN